MTSVSMVGVDILGHACLKPVHDVFVFAIAVEIADIGKMDLPTPASLIGISSSHSQRQRFVPVASSSPDYRSGVSCRGGASR